MTSRERVLAAMRHRRPDRTPFDFSWGFAPAQLQRFTERTGAADPGRLFRGRHPAAAAGTHALADRFLPYLGELPPARRLTSGASAGGRAPAATRPTLTSTASSIPLTGASSEADALAYPLPDLDAALPLRGFRRARGGGAGPRPCSARRHGLHDLRGRVVHAGHGEPAARLRRWQRVRIGAARPHHRAARSAGPPLCRVGRRRDLHGRRRRHAAGDADERADVAHLAEAAPRPRDRGRPVGSPRRPRLLPQRRQRHRDRGRPGRDRRRHPQPRPARVHGPGRPPPAVRRRASASGARLAPSRPFPFGTPDDVQARGSHADRDASAATAASFSPRRT